MRRAILPLLAIAFIGLTACRPKEPSFEEKVAANLTKDGLVIPDATGATVPFPHEGLLVLFYWDRVALESPAAFTVASGGMAIFNFDPARAATEGADPKYKAKSTDSVILPLRNAAFSFLEHGTPKRMLIASAAPPPAQLYKEVLATLADEGVTEG